MPPKAKTPSKEAATETTKLDQVLAMLQVMSEKVSGLDLRMVAVEKKSDAAREAVDAIKKVDKGDSLEKAREQRSERPIKGEERKASRREAYDKATALLGTTAAAEISASIKAIMQIVATAKSSSKKNEQAEYVETIQMAFETTLMGEIVSRSDRIWEVYSDNAKNRESAFVQERVMLTVLQNTLKPGTPAKTKYRLAKRKDVLNALVIVKEWLAP